MDYFHSKLSAEDLEKVVWIPTIAELLEYCRKTYGNLPAISDKTTTYSYEELYKRVAKRRDFIYKQNIPEGSHIAILARNDLDAMELYLAITTAGYTVVVFPASLQKTQVESIIKKFDVFGLFVASEFCNLTENVSCQVWESNSIGEAEAERAGVTEDTIATICLTGGTTGEPKGAVLTHGALMNGAYNGIFLPEPTSGNRYILMLPLSHIFGAVRSFLTPLYIGALIYSCVDMKLALVDIPKIKPTALVLVPGVMEIILNIAKQRGEAFIGSLKMIIAGGAPVPPKIIRGLFDVGVHIYPGYGLTEAACMTAGNGEAYENPESSGKLYSGQEYKIVDGELWLKGRMVMKEYYKDPERTAEVMKDGWLQTGDLARIDEEGYLYITGRIKNLIILPNGENVSPEEIEGLFYKREEVQDCQVREMEVNGRPVIGIEILPCQQTELSDEEIHLKMQEITKEINDTLPTYKRISTVVIRKEPFKKTASLKIAR